MLIKFQAKESISFRLFSWLFINSDESLFKKSWLLKIADYLSFPAISMTFLVLSLTCLWYEGFFTQIGADFVENYNFAAIFLLLAVIFCNKKRLLATKPIIYLLLFVLSMLVSAVFAAISGMELGMLASGFFLFCQFVLAFLVASTYPKKGFLVNAIILLSTPVALIGIYQGVWGADTSQLWVSSAETLIDARAFGFFGSPNVLGSVVMITTIISLVAFMNSKKWYYLAYLPIGFLAMIFSFSRSAWLGFAAGVTVLLLLRNWRLLFLIPLGLLSLLIPSIHQRLATLVSTNYLVDASLDGRIWSFNNAISVFNTAPIFGTGPGSYGGETAIYYSSPIYLRGMQGGYVALPYTDNQWLQVMVQGGLVGLFLAVCFFISLLVNNLRQYRKTGSCLCLGVIAVLIAVVANGLMANIWEFGAVAVLSGAYMGLGNSYEK